MGAGLLVFVGGGLGALLRYLAGLLAQGPLTTLAINVLGSFAIGLLVAVPSGPLRLFLAVGLLGGFTTFSAFSLDAVQLWQRGEAGMALAYVLGTTALSLAAVAAAAWLVRS
ncbi:MAG: fluoride efflux transporter CrcB [Sphingomonas bacterium]|nr:fluoride efflux transporter CrcB [Sphingomonas bacterium]